MRQHHHAVKSLLLIPNRKWNYLLNLQQESNVNILDASLANSFDSKKDNQEVYFCLAKYIKCTQNAIGNICRIRDSLFNVIIYFSKNSGGDNCPRCHQQDPDQRSLASENLSNMADDDNVSAFSFGIDAASSVTTTDTECNIILNINSSSIFFIAAAGPSRPRDKSGRFVKKAKKTRRMPPRKSDGRFSKDIPIKSTTIEQIFRIISKKLRSRAYNGEGPGCLL
jgi:hypothetical protein